MQQEVYLLDQFCNKYLPDYFVEKYSKDRKFKVAFYDYKNEGNVYQLTIEIFKFVDQLMSANPLLKPTKIINEYFLFQKSHFAIIKPGQIQKINENSKQNSNQNQDLQKIKDEEQPNQKAQKIKQIFYKMKEQNRKYLQIVVYFLYLYFDVKQIEVKTDPKKSTQRKEYRQRIISYYSQLKLFSCFETAHFVPHQFMVYALKMILDLKPNKFFVQLIEGMLIQLNFPQLVNEQITGKIKQIKAKIHMAQANRNLKLQQKQKYYCDQTTTSQTLTKIQSNQGTPIKERSLEKIQQNTLQTTDKKQNMVIKNQEKISFIEERMRKTLLFQDKLKSKSRQRTLYMRSKYLVPRTTLVNISKIPTLSQKLHKLNQMKETKLNELSRSFSSRYIKVQDCNDQGDFMGGATPKPKKKIKIQHSSGTQNLFSN